MVEPVSMAIALKFAAGFAGKIAVKMYFVGKMAGLKAFLTSYIGASAAGITVSALAAASTAYFWEKKVLQNSDEDAIAAAVAKGVSRDVAKGIAQWMELHA